MSASHVLVITGCAEDCTRDYEIECPGVTDDCRAWEVCACPDSAGGMDSPLWDDEVAHGVEHKHIDGEWMKPTDRCFVSTSHCMPEDADDLAEREHLGPGRYPIDFDYQGEGWYELDLIKSSEVAPR